MSEEVTEVLSGRKNKEPKIDMTVSDLQSIVAAITASQDDKLTKALDAFAAAIIESKKPYVDPKSAENDASMRESMKKQRELQIAQMQSSQEWCQHLQGSNALSKIPGQLTCIVRHRLDTTEVVGLCTNCGRIFREGDLDYGKWMRMANGNELSSAGQRSFLDPTSVKRAGR